MKSSKKNLTIITNLYPLPWEPNRATFNRQQFSLLDNKYNKSVLVPVAFTEWFKHRKQIKQDDNLRFVPYFYPPKIGRRFYSIFLFLSILLHSGLWLSKKKNHILLASWAFPEAVATKWLSKLYKCRFYFKVHGNDINLHANYPARAKQIVSAARHASGILSVSNALKEKMTSLGIEEDKVRVIYNGVNHDLFSQSQMPTIDGDYLLFVGNLKEAKGVFELLEGFIKIHQSFPHLKLVFAGPGDLRHKLLDEAKAKEVADRVVFLGGINHDELPPLMQHAKMVVLPSYNEGVPNVLLESMACGTPVLATTVGGIPEIVNQEICGQLIATKSAEQVAQGITRVLEKKWSTDAIIKHSQQFTWQRNRDQLVELLTT